MPSLLAFGEVLWDVVGSDAFLGGAPFNVAAHAGRCGLRPALYTRVGADGRGREARREMQRLGIADDWVQVDPDRPTGWVDVRLEDGQPSYAIAEDVAWDAIQAPDALRIDSLRNSRFDVLVCGTLAQRDATSREALRAVRAALPDVPVVYDVNLRPPFTPASRVWETLPGAAVVKLNEDEAALLSQAGWRTTLSPSALFERLRADFGCRLVLLTRGAQGCAILSADGAVDVPGIPVAVASAVGAGDAFLAAFLAKWLQGVPPAAAARDANRIGAWVASRPEAVPPYPAPPDGPSRGGATRAATGKGAAGAGPGDCR